MFFPATNVIGFLFAPASVKDMLNDLTKEDLKPEKKDLKAFKKTHILLSFEPDKILEVESVLRDLITKDYIEYEQSSN